MLQINAAPNSNWFIHWFEQYFGVPYRGEGPRTNYTLEHLVEADGLVHRRLDEQGLDVLPVLLKKRDQEVDRHHDVGQELVLSHINVTNSDTQAENLLELELDGGADLISLLTNVVRVSDGGGELAGLVETRSQETRNLLDQSLGGNESIVLLGELLDKLLVLVELLQVINRLELHTDLLGLIAVKGITENADGHLGARDVGETNGARETLITLRIVVLETNLELDSLEEVTLLLLGLLLDLANALADGRNLDFAAANVEWQQKVEKDKRWSSTVRGNCWLCLLE